MGRGRLVKSNGHGKCPVIRPTDFRGTITQPRRDRRGSLRGCSAEKKSMLSRWIKSAVRRTGSIDLKRGKDFLIALKIVTFCVDGRMGWHAGVGVIGAVSVTHAADRSSR